MRSFQRRKQRSQDKSGSQKSSLQFGPKVIHSVQRKSKGTREIVTQYAGNHHMPVGAGPASIQPQRLLGEPGNTVAPQINNLGSSESMLSDGIQRQTDTADFFGDRLNPRLAANPIQWGPAIAPPVTSPMQRQVIQTKLTVGEPGDAHEQQADNVASQVVKAINQPQFGSSQGVQAKQERESSLGIQQELGVQRTEDEDVDAKPLDSAVQRSDDEEVMEKPLDSALQRNSEEADEVDMKPLESALQRSDDEEVMEKPLESALQRSDDEEVMEKPLESALQRSDDEEVMEKPLDSALQRSDDEEVMEKPLDSAVQRSDDEEVMEKPLDSAVQRKGANCNKDEADMKPLDSAVQREDDEAVDLKSEVRLQRNALGGGPTTPQFETQVRSAKGGGQALNSTLQAKMGEAMGADFSGVRVHSNPQSHQLSQAIQAKAFTTGQDVFFNRGQYQPSSHQGQELIAHELTHVVQQKGAAVQRKKKDSASGKQ